MTIRPINGVSFRNNYNQVNFEGRKKEGHQSPSMVTNTIKSIPLAAVIAMSPLAASAQYPPVEIARAKFEKAEAITDEPGEIGFYDTDGNPENGFELAQLQFKKQVRYNEKIGGKSVPVEYTASRFYNISGLEVEDVTEKFKDGTKNHYKRYYINASAELFKGPVRTADSQARLVKNGTHTELKNTRLQVTDEVYSYLAKIYDGYLEPVVKKVTEDGDANDLMYDLYGY